jgi:hypothetical protein
MEYPADLLTRMHEYYDSVTDIYPTRVFISRHQNPNQFTVKATYNQDVSTHFRFSELEFVRGYKEPKPYEYAWFVSRKDLNKLMHALIGNGTKTTNKRVTTCLVKGCKNVPKMNKAADFCFLTCNPCEKLKSQKSEKCQYHRHEYMFFPTVGQLARASEMKMKLACPPCLDRLKVEKTQAVAHDKAEQKKLDLFNEQAKQAHIDRIKFDMDLFRAAEEASEVALRAADPKVSPIAPSPPPKLPEKPKSSSKPVTKHVSVHPDAGADVAPHTSFPLKAVDDKNHLGRVVLQGSKLEKRTLPELQDLIDTANVFVTVDSSTYADLVSLTAGVELKEGPNYGIHAAECDFEGKHYKRTIDEPLVIRHVGPWILLEHDAETDMHYMSSMKRRKLPEVVATTKKNVIDDYTIVVNPDYELGHQYDSFVEPYDIRKTNPYDAPHLWFLVDSGDYEMSEGDTTVAIFGHVRRTTDFYRDEYDVVTAIRDHRTLLSIEQRELLLKETKGKAKAVASVDKPLSYDALVSAHAKAEEQYKQANTYADVTADTLTKCAKGSALVDSAIKDMKAKETGTQDGDDEVAVQNFDEKIDAIAELQKQLSAATQEAILVGVEAGNKLSKGQEPQVKLSKATTKLIDNLLGTKEMETQNLTVKKAEKKEPSPPPKMFTDGQSFTFELEYLDERGLRLFNLDGDWKKTLLNLAVDKYVTTTTEKDFGSWSRPGARSGIFTRLKHRLRKNLKMHFLDDLSLNPFSEKDFGWNRAHASPIITITAVVKNVAKPGDAELRAPHKQFVDATGPADNVEVEYLVCITRPKRYSHDTHNTKPNHFEEEFYPFTMPLYLEKENDVAPSALLHLITDNADAATTCELAYELSTKLHNNSGVNTKSSPGNVDAAKRLFIATVGSLHLKRSLDKAIPMSNEYGGLESTKLTINRKVRKKDFREVPDVKCDTSRSSSELAPKCLTSQNRSSESSESTLLTLSKPLPDPAEKVSLPPGSRRNSLLDHTLPDIPNSLSTDSPPSISPQELQSDMPTGAPPATEPCSSRCVNRPENGADNSARHSIDSLTPDSSIFSMDEPLIPSHERSNWKSWSGTFERNLAKLTSKLGFSLKMRRTRSRNYPEGLQMLPMDSSCVLPQSSSLSRRESLDSTLSLLRASPSTTEYNTPVNTLENLDLSKQTTLQVGKVFRNQISWTSLSGRSTGTSYRSLEPSENNGWTWLLRSILLTGRTSISFPLLVATENENQDLQTLLLETD